MKNLLLIIFISCNTLGFSQIATSLYSVNTRNEVTVESAMPTIDVYKFEMYTQKGVVIFGVAKTKNLAKWVIDDFTERNS